MVQAGWIIPLMGISSGNIKTAGLSVPADDATGTFARQGDTRRGDARRQADTRQDDMRRGGARQGSPRQADRLELAQARRGARLVLAVLWVGFLCGTLLWTADVTFGVMVLLVGISTFLESVHGALGLERLRRRFRS